MRARNRRRVVAELESLDRAGAATIRWGKQWQAVASGERRCRLAVESRIRRLHSVAFGCGVVWLVVVVFMAYRLMSR